MITVFGSINLDMIGTVERLPRPGETVGGGVFATAPGGKGANQALAAARAGAAVRMVGAVGNDAFAEPALHLLREAGIDMAGVRRVDGATGIALILVDAAGENVIAVMPGANAAVAPVDAEGLDFAPGEVLLLQLEVPIAAIEVVARRAKQAGASVLLNFTPFQAEAARLLTHATHVIVNEHECAALAREIGLAGGAIDAHAAALADHFGLAVIATLGRDGAIAADGATRHRAAALPVQAVDTVGAGDTFCGYLAAGLAGGSTLADALRLACAAGSLACTRSGAQPAIPRRAEVERAVTG